MNWNEQCGAAFPIPHSDKPGAPECERGMSLRDWFAGQALANAVICTGEAADWQITVWFGNHRTGITRSQIVAKQALCYADAMIEARK